MLTKEKGDIALANAIRYFLTSGYEVCLPIGDKRAYDLVIEKSGILQKVQVKYAGLYKNGKCKAGLRTTGGNQSFHTAKKYEDDAFDILFVHTAKNQNFVIPWAKVFARNEITIEHPKYSEYLIMQG